MILHLKIIEAKDIPKMDIVGTADPFVIFKISPSLEEYQTKVIKQNTRPIWNEVFHIPFNPKMKPTLHMELFDWDKVTANDLISTRDFQISDYETGVVIDDWFEFFAAPKVPNPGKVHLVIHIALPHEEPFKNREVAPQAIEEPLVLKTKSVVKQIEEEEEDHSEPPPPSDKYTPFAEKPLAKNATEDEKKEFDYNHKIRGLTELISSLSNGYLKPINFCYVDRLINIRGKKHPIAVFLKPVSSELSPTGVFVYDTTRMSKNKALYFFIGPQSQKSLESFGDTIVKCLSEESNCNNIIKITDMKSPEFQQMVHQMGGHQRMILSAKNYGEELVFERSFFAEKLRIKMFEKTKRTTCVSIDFDSVPSNGALVIDPNDFALYLYLDNIDPKTDEEKQSLIAAIEWMKNQPRFDKRELFVFDRTRVPYTVQLMIR